MSPPLGTEQPSLDLANKLKHVEEGKGSVEQDPKLAIQASSVGGKALIGSVEHLQEVENRRAVKVTASSKFIGLALVFTAGACYSLFGPAFNLSTNDQWHKLDEGVDHLVVYTAFFYFSLAFFACAVLINVCFLYRPAFGVPKSSLTAYFRDNNGRWIAFLAGILCGWGNGFQFMGGQAAGYAAADAVQALPLVSTFWGIVIFGEYRRASKRTYFLLAVMLAMFAAAVGLLIGSAGERKN
ncbi:Phospholipid metabolism protein [Trebouxia sp. C0010 RCD-2024]